MSPGVAALATPVRRSRTVSSRRIRAISAATAAAQTTGSFATARPSAGPRRRSLETSIGK